MSSTDTLTVAVVSACAAVVTSEIIRRSVSWAWSGAEEHPGRDKTCPGSDRGYPPSDPRGEPLPELGKKLRDREFSFVPNIHPLNNGSYGAVPKRILGVQQSLIEEREGQPEDWYRHRLLGRYQTAVGYVAEFVGAKAENLVLVENVTTATNSIVKSFKFEAGDQVLMTNHTYGAVITTMKFVTDINPEIGLVSIDIPVQTTAKEIIDLHTKALDDNPRIKLALLDHITSFSAIVLPIRELIEVCHSRGVVVAVDGAHGPGQLPLNLEELGADFYYGNLHKWLFTPRSCALLYIHPKHHSWIRPAISSHYTFRQDIHERFHSIGTRDNIPYLTAEHALRFHHYLGGLERIVAYNSELAYWAADMLAAAWNTTWIKLEPELRAPFMCLVVLPQTPQLAQYKCPNGNNKLMYEIAKESVVAVVTGEDEEMFLRISAHVYNYKEEYYALRDAIIRVLALKV